MARTTAMSLVSLTVPLLLASLVSTAAPALAQVKPAAAMSPTSADIDRDVWTAISASVVSADIGAMGKTYHPAAVLVSNAGTKPIAQVLEGWGKDMVTAKKDGIRATVELRFSKRQDDATTAFEVGIFKYTTTDRAGVSKSAYTQFEALLIKTNGKWQNLMERQRDPSTGAAFDALPH